MSQVAKLLCEEGYCWYSALMLPIGLQEYLDRSTAALDLERGGGNRRSSTDGGGDGGGGKGDDT